MLSVCPSSLKILQTYHTYACIPCSSFPCSFTILCLESSIHFIEMFKTTEMFLLTASTISLYEIIQFFFLWSSNFYVAIKNMLIFSEQFHLPQRKQCWVWTVSFAELGACSDAIRILLFLHSSYEVVIVHETQVMKSNYWRVKKKEPKTTLNLLYFLAS